MKKKIILLLLLSFFLCSCSHVADNDNSFSEVSGSSENEHLSNADENSFDEHQTESESISDEDSMEDSIKDSMTQYPAEAMDATVKPGDVVHLCCYRSSTEENFSTDSNHDKKTGYLGGVVLKVNDADSCFMQNEAECPETLAPELAKNIIGKNRWSSPVVCRDGKYEYLFRMNMVNMTVEPSYLLPKDWDYRFSPSQIGSFKDYEEDGAGVIDRKDGLLFGYEDRLTMGCSSWCGCIDYVCEVSASSVLAKQGNVSYDAAHLAEDTREKIWSEGAEGAGIGESIQIKQMYLGTGNAELSFYSICIVNGYAKNETKWQENGRIKSLKLYYEGEYMGLISLEDTMDPQYIDISAVQMRVGNGFAADFRFEIAEVYEGSKYEDTCLTGIVIDFKGIYAH